MIPLAMVVLDELRDCVPEVALTDWNDPIETFCLDRPYESLGVAFALGARSGISTTRAVSDELLSSVGW